MNEARQALALPGDVQVKKEATVTIEIEEDQGKDDVVMLSVEPRIKKSTRPRRAASRAATK